MAKLSNVDRMKRDISRDCYLPGTSVLFEAGYLAGNCFHVVKVYRFMGWAVRSLQSLVDSGKLYANQVVVKARFSWEDLKAIYTGADSMAFDWVGAFMLDWSWCESCGQYKLYDCFKACDSCGELLCFVCLHDHVRNKRCDTIIPVELLERALPHGSGVNGSWQVWADSRGEIHAANFYDAMNEAGFYCHCYDFEVVYKYNGADSWRVCEICHGAAKRYMSEMAAFGWAVDEWRAKMPDFPLIWDIAKQDWYFICNYCKGAGKLINPVFEMVRFNFHGQRERRCCGDGLVDYLGDLFADIDYLVRDELVRGSK